MAKPVELSRSSRFVILASVCVVVAALYFAQEVLIPLALSVLITFLLTPLVRWLERTGMGRILAVLLVVTLALTLFAGLGWMLKNQFIQLADELPGYRTQIKAKFDRFSSAGGSFGSAIKKVENTVQLVTPKAPTTQATQPSTLPASAETMNIVQPPAEAPGKPALPHVTPENPLPVRLYPEPPSPAQRAMDYLGPVLGPLGMAGLVIVFVVFMLLNREDLRDRLIRLVGHGQLMLTTEAMDEAGSRISRYLIAQSLINTCYGTLVAAGLWMIGRLLGHGHGFPNYLLWGLLCGAFRFVPYVGPWIGAAGPLLIAFGFFPTNAVFFATVAMFVGLELITSQAIEPLIYGSSTGMSTLAVLVAAVFWTWLWGPIGLLLSTPLTAVLVVIGKYVPQLGFLDILLGDEPVLEPPVRLYQRLLAEDEREAEELAAEFLGELGLLGVYDEVLLPALAMAEQDRVRERLSEEAAQRVSRFVRSLIDRLYVQWRETPSDENKGAAAGNGKPAEKTNGQSPEPAAEEPQDIQPLPAGCTVNVLILPAHDEADEIAGLMLGRLLEQRRFCAQVLSQAALASEMVEAVQQHQSDLIAVSALPPEAVSHARYLCRRLHNRYDGVNMLIGLWTARGDVRQIKDRITCEATVQVSLNLRDALAVLQQMAQPVILRTQKMEVRS